MKKIAIIGAGVSGLTMGRLLFGKADVTIYEAASRPGGLIRCERVGGSLFHTCGGHVFNTKREDVREFFWSLFDREREFVKADRNSVISMPDGSRIPYPIENYAYLFDDTTLNAIISDVISLKKEVNRPDNFGDFLKKMFGQTLYELYFRPYNEKIWRRDLSQVPLAWLEGKLPMPSPEEIVFNNIRKIAEKKFVHSSFWYENNGGSQFLADRMAEGLDVRYGTRIETVASVGDKWIVNGDEYDAVVFCGNIKQLPSCIEGVDISGWIAGINSLESHGTTSVFCEIESNNYSWIYLPDDRYEAHRIICTGNFSPSNNAPGKMTGSIEFTDRISKEEILSQLRRIPLAPKYITHCYNEFTYPIQDAGTRKSISSLKKYLSAYNFYMTGRFADWEYYNMDVAMGAAMDLFNTGGISNFVS